MPIRQSERHRYPKNWKQISHRIRFERAGGKCEWPFCEAPHGEVIFRLKADPEQWRDVNPGDLEEPDPNYRAVKVILTVAHLDHQPENCDDTNLMALCQLHDLRYDKDHHAKNSSATRHSRRNGGASLFA